MDDEDEALVLPDPEDEPPEPFEPPDELPDAAFDELSELLPELLPEDSEELEDAALAVSFLSPPEVDAPAPLAEARESVL